MDKDDLKYRVFTLVAAGHKRYKPSDLARTLARSLGVDKKDVKSAIAELTEEGRLIYTYAGHSWLEVPADHE
jgi:DNA-binding MarR family transcriptional regulator